MRRRAAPKRTILPDPKYGNERLAKFVNQVMRNGKKSVAEHIVYGALDILWQKEKANAQKGEGESGGEAGGAGAPVLDLFEQALNNVRPNVEVKSRRVGGSTYQVPIEVSGTRGTALAMRWLIEAAKGRHEKSMVNRLAGEMLDAFHGRGTAVKKRDDTHRMAKANQAFAHYRW